MSEPYPKSTTPSTPNESTFPRPSGDSGFNAPFRRLDPFVLRGIEADLERSGDDRRYARGELARREAMGDDDAISIDAWTIDVEEDDEGHCVACGARGDGMRMACPVPGRGTRHDHRPGTGLSDQSSPSSWVEAPCEHWNDPADSPSPSDALMASFPYTIKIRRGPEISETAALKMVLEVIEGCRVSEGPQGPCYCWATEFSSSEKREAVVWSHRTATMDVFRVTGAKS